MKRVQSGLQKVENLLIIITFVVMTAASFAQVCNRNIFKFGVGWFEELAIYCMIWMVMLGTEMGLRDGTQASITALVDRLPGKVGQAVLILARLIVTVFTGMMAYSSFGMVAKQMETGQTSAALHLPMWIPYSALLVGFFIMALVQAVATVTMVVRLLRPKAESEEKGGDGE